MAGSKLDFIVELEFPTTLVRRCLTMEIQLFGSSLLKFIKPKLLFGLVDPCIGYPMSAIEFFQLIENFSAIIFW